MRFLFVILGFNGHFTWKGYLQLEKAIAAPEELFDSTPIEHGFQVGMKLEAVDQENPVNICVATVTQVRIWFSNHHILWPSKNFYAR